MTTITRRSAIAGSLGAVAAGALVLGPAGAADAAGRPLVRRGSRGRAVRYLQRRLVALGYWLGPQDGVFGSLTEQAVYAVQKAAGLTRDGVVGPVTWARIDAGTRPRARYGGRLVEIDLDRQLLLIVSHGKVETILNTSTGSGERYFSQGRWDVATTPPGAFHVLREVDDWDPGPLGDLYRPKYFNGGIAVHGYADVPPRPVSHGCCRVSLKAMDMIWQTTKAMPIGRTVRVY